MILSLTATYKHVISQLHGSTIQCPSAKLISQSTMKKKHEHDFKQWEVRTIKVIQNPDYIGTAGDRAFLVQTCSCGKVQPRDYGTTQIMNEMLATLL